jgi:hypothetical protein
MGAFTFQTPAGPVPDLVVQSVTHYPASPTSLDLITVTTTVTNAGSAAAAASWLEVCVAGEPSCALTLVPALGAGGTASVHTELPPHAAGTYTITVTADYNDQVSDSNRTNNSAVDNCTVATATQGYTVSGVIYNAAPLPGVLVELGNVNSTMPPLRRMTTGADGSYSFGSLPPDAYWVRVSAPGPEYIPSITGGLTLGNGDGTLNIDLPKKLTLLTPTNGQTVALTPAPILTWEANPDATRYFVQISEIIQGVWTDLLVTNVTGTSFAVPAGTLHEFGTFYWHIGAYSAAGHNVGESYPSFTFDTTIAAPIVGVSAVAASAEKRDR